MLMHYKTSSPKSTKIMSMTKSIVLLILQQLIRPCRINMRSMLKWWTIQIILWGLARNIMTKLCIKLQMRCLNTLGLKIHSATHKRFTKRVVDLTLTSIRTFNKSFKKMVSSLNRIQSPPLMATSWTSSELDQAKLPRMLLPYSWCMVSLIPQTAGSWTITQQLPLSN